MSQTRPAAPAARTRDLLRLAWPILVSQLAIMGMALIDTVMAGRLSPQDLGVVALGSSIYATVYVSFMGVVQALTPIAGHHFGAGRHRDIGIELQQSLWLVLLMSVFGIALLLWSDLWLGITRAEPAVAAGLTTYLWALAIGLPAGLATRAFVSINAAVSRPQATMVIQLLGLAAKVPLNLVFMHGWGPLPAMGGAGCGVATAVVVWLTLALNAWLWSRDPFYAGFRSGRFCAPTWARLREHLQLGLPAGGSLLLEVSSFTLIAMLLARFGAVTLGAHHIVANVISLLFMVPLALGVAAGVLVAQSLGAGDARQARRAAFRGWRLSTALVLAFALTLVLGRDAIVAAYTSNAEVAALAAVLLVAGAAFHLFDGIQGVSGFILRGYKVALAPLLIHVVALWGVGLAGGYVLAFHPPPRWQVSAAISFWGAAAVGLALAAVALTWTLIGHSRREVRRSATALNLPSAAE